MVTLVNVATGMYLDYWRTLTADADARLFPDEDLRIVVFTDRAEEAEHAQRSLKRTEVVVVPIPPLGWPEAGRERYALISDHADLMQGSVVVYLDADMRIPTVVGPELTPRSWQGGLAMVRHPGFFRKNWSPAHIARVPKRAVRDLVMQVGSEGGLGQWERNPESMAFVPRRLRRNYVCGGVWMGRQEPLLSMTQLLADRTRVETDRGIKTRWVDESFLNWFVAHNPVTLLDPSYCYVEADPLLNELPPRIIAVEKGAKRVRTSIYE